MAALCGPVAVPLAELGRLVVAASVLSHLVIACVLSGTFASRESIEDQTTQFPLQEQPNAAYDARVGDRINVAARLQQSQCGVDVYLPSAAELALQLHYLGGQLRPFVLERRQRVAVASEPASFW